MNGKITRALRKLSNNRAEYQALKRFAHADQGQNPKRLVTRKHKQKAPAKPSWPATADQRQQSRPLIVLHPWRQFSPTSKIARRAFRAACNFKPKWMLDRAVLRGYF